MTYIKPGSERSQNITLRDLEGYFAQFAKPKEKHRYGLECELFGLNASTGLPIPFYGSRGIEGVFEQLANQFGWQRLEERGHVVALERKGDSITLEPGGQMELSAAPVKRLIDIEEQVKSFHRELKVVGEKIGISWLSMGAQPLATSGQMPWVPKARYEIMRQYLAHHGSRSHDMMQRTATNQFNIDYENESDAVEKMRLIFRISPFVTAAFANSPIFEGQVNGFQSFRMHIWQGTDPERTGLIRPFVEGVGSFESYLNYVLDVSSFFIVRQGEWISLEGLPFRDFVEKGFGPYHATLDDFELHLSTVFPECRLKNHIELRCVDAQAPEFIMAPCAFWAGLLASSETINAGTAEVEEFSWFEISAFYRDLPRSGLRAKVGVRSVDEIVKNLFNIAYFGLAPSDDANREDNRRFLEGYMDRFVHRKKTPADQVLENWKNDQSAIWRTALAHLQL